MLTVENIPLLLERQRQIERRLCAQAWRTAIRWINPWFR